MSTYAQIDPLAADPKPVIGWFDTTANQYPAMPPQNALVTITADQYAARVANPAGWVIIAGALSAAQPPLAQQALAMLAAGVTIVSTATPALNGTYAVGPNDRSNLTSMYSLIDRAGGSFPSGLTALPWPDASGAVHTFAKVADFLNFETAIGGWVLVLQLMITTGAGELPSATVTIP